MHNDGTRHGHGLVAGRVFGGISNRIGGRFVEIHRIIHFYRYISLRSIHGLLVNVSQDRCAAPLAHVRYAGDGGGPALPISLHGPRGKPYLVGDELSFNLSHSGKLALIGVARTELGLDVEKVRRLDSLTQIAHSSAASIDECAVLIGRRYDSFVVCVEFGVAIWLCVTVASCATNYLMVRSLASLVPGRLAAPATSPASGTDSDSSWMPARRTVLLFLAIGLPLCTTPVLADLNTIDLNNLWCRYETCFASRFWLAKCLVFLRKF